MKLKIYNIIIFGGALLIIIIFGCRKEKTTTNEESKINYDCVEYKAGATVITYDSLGWPHGTTQDSVKFCGEKNWRPDDIVWTSYYD
jgi:hypothetical protein